jgi:hypothetical protein
MGQAADAICGMCGRVHTAVLYGERVSDGTSDHFLRDLGPLMMDMARSAKADADSTDDPFQRGRLMGLYEAVSLLVQQADAFGMDRDQVGLAGSEPERDLL